MPHPRQTTAAVTSDELLVHLMTNPEPARRLPFAPRPAAEETLPSYLQRLAHELDASLATILHGTGLTESIPRLFPDAYGAVLPGQQTKAFANACNLERSDVEQMLLSRLDGPVRLASFARSNGSGCGILSRDWTDADRFHICALCTAGSAFCPSCLAENGGAWRLNWKLPWSFACTKHQLLLVDRCPRCDSRSSPADRGEAGGSGILNDSPPPGLCPRRLPPDYDDHVPGSRCEGDLTVAPHVPLERHKGLLAIQVRLNRLLHGEQATVAAIPVSTSDFFTDLRAVAAILYAGANLTDLGSLPDPVRDAFAAHADARSAWAGQNKWSRPQSGNCWCKHAERNVLLVAAMIPAAAETLLTSSKASLAERLLTPLERAQKHTPALTRLPYDLQLSDPLQQTLHSLLPALPKRFASEAGLTAGERGRRIYRYKIEDVPPLLWNDVYENDFAPLFPGTRPPQGRRFCSLALVKLCTNHSWNDAATALGLPVRGEDFAGRMSRRLREAGNDRTFQQRLHELASRLEQPEVHNGFAAKRRDH
jgi:TniQ